MEDSLTDNVYDNPDVGAIENVEMPEPDENDEAFAQSANAVLSAAADVARALVGAHQSAAALVVSGDWKSVRKYFSLSPKYEKWREYKTAAAGFGVHNWILAQKETVRWTQAELEAHPEWLGFGTEGDKHPPMRGWLAAPINDSAGRNWGLIQVSDKYEGDFTEDDEQHFTQFAALVSLSLEGLWQVRNLQKQLQGAGEKTKEKPPFSP